MSCNIISNKNNSLTDGEVTESVSRVPPGRYMAPSGGQIDVVYAGVVKVKEFENTSGLCLNSTTCEIALVLGKRGIRRLKPSSLSSSASPGSAWTPWKYWATLSVGETNTSDIGTKEGCRFAARPCLLIVTYSGCAKSLATLRFAQANSHPAYVPDGRFCWQRGGGVGRLGK